MFYASTRTKSAEYGTVDGPYVWLKAIGHGRFWRKIWLIVVSESVSFWLTICLEVKKVLNFEQSEKSIKQYCYASAACVWDRLAKEDLGGLRQLGCSEHGAVHRSIVTERATVRFGMCPAVIAVVFAARCFSPGLRLTGVRAAVVWITEEECTVMDGWKNAKTPTQAESSSINKWVAEERL